MFVNGWQTAFFNFMIDNAHKISKESSDTLF